ADVFGLVVGRDQDRDLVLEAGGHAGLAELLPGEALERRRELARGTRPDRERAQVNDERDEEGEDGKAEVAAAVALLEGEGGEQAVDDFGAVDDRQGDPGE